MNLTISSKGGVVIPAELRKKYRLRPGDEVQVVDYGGALTLVPIVGNPIHQAAGLLKGGSSLAKDLLTERRAERRREKRHVG